MRAAAITWTDLAKGTDCDGGVSAEGGSSGSKKIGGLGEGTICLKLNIQWHLEFNSG